MNKLVMKLISLMEYNNFIIVGLTRYEWKYLLDNLLVNGKRTHNYWISKDGSCQIRRYTSGNNIRGVKHNGKRATAFLTNNEHILHTEKDINTVAACMDLSYETGGIVLCSE